MLCRRMEMTKTLWCLLIVVPAIAAQVKLGLRLQISGSRNSSKIPFNSPKNVLYMFDRMLEPIFLERGNDDNKIVFKLPPEYLPPRYQTVDSSIIDRFGEDPNAQGINVKPISLPDLTIPLKLGRRENFSLFLPAHRRMAVRLIETFMGMRTFEDFLSVSVYCRDRINPYMYVYALSVAILHRPDTQSLQLPPLSEIFPDKFLDGGIFSQARQEAVVVPTGSRIPIVIPRDYTASNLDPEHRVAYFREDLGINLHHWHWHLNYPLDGPINIVNKDRRGELFFYMHQQIIARYNFERLSNGLARVKRLLNWNEPIPEGYFPKLDSLVSSRVWPPRHSGAILRDINREIDQIKFDLHDLEIWRDRIYDGIHLGFVKHEQGADIPLSESNGIDILGNLMEASRLSINRNYYGDLHNLGHVAMGLCHDPDGRHLETFGVIGDPATAMRDPIFYRWHAFVDDIFQEHKKTLPRYTVQQLNFDNIRVTGMEVETQGNQRNTFLTYWQKSEVDLSRGMDFTPRGSVYARFEHLQHLPFVYRIQVDNAGAARMGTIRVYLAPKYDERGLPMLFEDQRLLFIEIDKFVVNIQPGQNVFLRRGTESSVTIPFETTFRNLNQQTNSTEEQNEFTFCGCGWPQHMLIPKGDAYGLQSELFVMISNYVDDRVDQPAPTGCQKAHSYCGLRDRLYPDRRPMGFPFDRMPRDGVNTLRQFMTPNMGVLDVLIQHTNDVPRGTNTNGVSPTTQRQ